MSNPTLPNTPGPPAATVVQRTPPVVPGGPEAAPEGTDRYELLGELARGGMGVVYRARDRVLDREVGLKTLLGAPGEGTTAVHRFREEARITAGLQHPNVPPVHDLGTLADGRPFLAMKLIRGRTLYALLSERPDPAHDRGRFVAAFEQIAHGVAFAHAHGVIHRDLKPLNVMVGAFGEVQVMDWGLAKELGTRDGAPGAREPRAAAPGDATTAGSVFGTPAYMPPEQARGETDRIDARSDVFSLGGVLCAILTGAPPYVGTGADDTHRLAVAARLDDARARLDACGAEPELVALCKKCLSPERADRPADAGAVALAVGDLRAEAERRAREAELDRAAAEARAAEHRKRARVQLALAAAVGLLLVGSGAFAWWRDRQERDREAERLRLEGERAAADARADAERAFKLEQARRGIDANLRIAAELRAQARFAPARAAVAQALELAATAPDRLPTAERARADLELAARLDAIRYDKWEWRTNEQGQRDFDTAGAPPAYRAALAGTAYDPLAGTVEEAARRVATADVRAELLAALDDWALYEPDAPTRGRLLEVARRAEPGPWLDRLRDPTARAVRVAVGRLAEDADPVAVRPAALSALAGLMERHKLDPTPMLARARARHPGEFDLAFVLAQWHAMNSRDGREIAPYEAARALRPENRTVWLNLGAALGDTGDTAGALVVLRRAAELSPERANVRHSLGVALARSGDRAGAIAAFRESLRLGPSVGAHRNLAVELSAAADPAAALEVLRTGAERFPTSVPLLTDFGIALRDAGDHAGSLVPYRAAVKHARADDAKPRFNLGVALRRTGDLPGSVAAYREAVRIDPKHVGAWTNMGGVLYAQQDYAGAREAYRRAADLEPDSARAHFNMGVVDSTEKRYADALVHARRAVALDANHAGAHALLGDMLLRTGDVPGARVAIEAAIRLDPARYGVMRTWLPPLPVAPPPRPRP